MTATAAERKTENGGHLFLLSLILINTDGNVLIGILHCHLICDMLNLLSGEMLGL